MILMQSTPSSVVVALLLYAGNVYGGPPQAADKSSPMIVVTASFPGANASVVRDTVAEPIEQQVNGVENALRLASQCTSDGNYILVVTFKPGADLDQAQVLVQNRVALALPILPSVVHSNGVAVKKKAPVRMLVSLSSTDGRQDALYLSNYATMHLKNDLCRVAGVGEVIGFGLRDYSMRVWIDSAKLEARNLSANEVMKALQQQNLQIASGKLAQPPARKNDGEIIVTATGRLTDPEQFADIVLRTDGKGTLIRLKDVARIERDAGLPENYVSLNGKPGVVLGVYPIGAANRKELSAAVVDRIGKLRTQLPKGLRLEVAFDFTANLEAPGGPKTAEYLLLDVHLANGARQALSGCDKLLRGIAGVLDVLALAENPFDVLHNHPCLLVRLTPADKRKLGREEIMQTIRTKLAKTPGAVVRLRDLSRPDAFLHCGYPIDLAVSGPEADKVRELAQKLGDRLQKSKNLTDVWVNQESVPRPCLQVDIDAAAIKKLGVAPEDIASTLQVFLGSAHVNNFNPFGRSWQIVIQADAKLVNRAEDLKQIAIRNKRGQMVPLANVATIRTSSAPGAINRLDLRPMVDITANPAAQVSLAEARAMCEALFEEMRRESRLPAEYRVTTLPQ